MKFILNPTLGSCVYDPASGINFQRDIPVDIPDNKVDININRLVVQGYILRLDEEEKKPEIHVPTEALSTGKLLGEDIAKSAEMIEDKVAKKDEKPAAKSKSTKKAPAKETDKDQSEEAEAKTEKAPTKKTPAKRVTKKKAPAKKAEEE